MKGPLISVCLPNFNTRAFLPERVETIFGQTHHNWEIIISDNFSDDGSWEFFQKLAREDHRIAIEQAPREGMYSNWNNCVRRARGEYVYIATSDDTMASDCLEKLVAALEEHKDCDVASCTLRVLDETGAVLTDTTLGYADRRISANGRKKLNNKRTIHRAPYDGLLHVIGAMVHSSITKLLIRRSIFSRAGDFLDKWGSVGDFHWEMKAGLVANAVYVPETWASWRVRSKQASESVNVHSAEHARKFEEMVPDALQVCEAYLPPAVATALRSSWLDRARELRVYYAGLRQRQDSTLRRRLFQISQLLGGTMSVRSEVIGRLWDKPKWVDRAPDEIRDWLESLGINAVVTVSS